MTGSPAHHIKKAVMSALLTNMGRALHALFPKPNN